MDGRHITVYRQQEDVEKIGEKIKSARREKELSQEELGEMMGLSRKQVCEYEKGKHEMGVTVLLQFARALQVSPEVLCPDDCSKFRQQRIEFGEMVYYATQLSEDMVKSITSLLKTMVNEKDKSGNKSRKKE